MTHSSSKITTMKEQRKELMAEGHCNMRNVVKGHCIRKVGSPWLRVWDRFMCLFVYD